MNRTQLQTAVSTIVLMVIVALIFRYLWWLILLLLLPIVGFVIYGLIQARRLNKQMENTTAEELDIDRTFYQSYSNPKKNQSDIIDVEYEEHTDGE